MLTLYNTLITQFPSYKFRHSHRAIIREFLYLHKQPVRNGRVETESGGTRRRTGGEVKGKEANGVGSQAGFILTRNSASSVTTIVLARPALQESQYSTELTPPPI